MTKEQFAILLKAKHIIVPQAEAAIAYLNGCDIETAVKGHYDLYLVAHNEFNTKVSDLVLNSLVNLIPKTTKFETLANIYCIMAADYLKKRKFHKAINLYFEYKNLHIDNHKLDYNFDGFMLNIYGENGLFREHKELADKYSENPYFKEVDGYVAAVFYYNNAIIAEEAKDEELLKNSVLGLSEIVTSKRHTEYPEKIIYIYELIELVYLNYQAKTNEEYQEVMRQYKDFVLRYESHQELSTLKILSAHLSILKTFVKNNECQYAIDRLNEMLLLDPETKVRLDIYKVLCDCYKETDVEKYYSMLEKLNAEYMTLLKSLQENLNDGILNTIKLYETRKSYNEIQKRFEIDQLTGCYNRNVLRKKSIELFDLKGEGAIIFFDLDNLKEANDFYSHSYGDEYLRLFVQGVQDCIPSSCYLFRYGGDEFIITTPFKDSKRLEKLVRKIYRKFSEPVKIYDQYIKIDFSAGVAIYPDDGENFEEVLNKADTAMYEAKKGRFSYIFVKDKKDEKNP